MFAVRMLERLRRERVREGGQQMLTSRRELGLRIFFFVYFNVLMFAPLQGVR